MLTLSSPAWSCDDLVMYVLLCVFVLKRKRKHTEVRCFRCLNFPQFSLLRQWASIPAFAPIFTASDPFPSSQIPAAAQISLSRSTNLLASHSTWKPQISQDCVAAGRPVEPRVCTWLPVMISIALHEPEFLFLSVHACHQLWDES